MSKSIIFDMDGVIFDTERMILEIWKSVAECQGIKDIEHVMHQCIGGNLTKTKEIFLMHYGEAFTYDAFRKEADTIFHQKAKSEGIPVKEGVKDLLEFLKEQEYRIGLASSTRIQIVKDELKEAGLLSFFDELVGGDMVSQSKPHPEIYLKACEKLKVEPAQTLAIEDSFNGVRSASAAGIKTIMVPDLLAPNEEIKSLLYKQFNTLLEVKDFLANNTCI